MWYERSGDGVGYLRVDSPRVRVQDYGNVGFDVLSFAPLGGWSATGVVEAIEGHTYALDIDAGSGDVNYAKVTVIDVFVDDESGVFVPKIDLDWGYQPVENEIQLKSTRRKTGEVRIRKNTNGQGGLS